MHNLEQLGQAVENLQRRGPEDQDQRGWNRCLDAIEKEYQRLEDLRKDDDEG